MVSVAWLCFGVACVEFDTARVGVSRGTLGEEVVRVLCERFAKEADPMEASGLRWKRACRGESPLPDDASPKLKAFFSRRVELAKAIDAVLVEEDHEALERFLQAILPLYDPPEEKLVQNSRLLADLASSFGQDQKLMEALARFGTRKGYRPPRDRLGTPRAILNFEGFPELVREGLGLIAQGGEARAEWLALQSALALEMAAFEPESERPSSLALLRDLLLKEHPDFAQGEPVYAVRRDERGLALPREGRVALPFVDRNGDGLADVDALGRFVGSDGRPIEVPTPFEVPGEGPLPRDRFGRAIDRESGLRLYEYIDLDRSLLSALIAEAHPWLEGEEPLV
ncbi:MAG: hypothetical protein N2515_09295, partial [Deltaproteobacteria bacterium]|nr:hypothetical protein [Deltaproteobacteria bacterium]